MTAMEELSGGFLDNLGMTVTHADGDGMVATITVGPGMHQPYGIVHGGVYCSIVETLGSVGGAMWWGNRGNVVGVSNNTNFIRAVRSGTLEARATPIQRGRSQQLWSVDISDEQGRLVATGQVRLANLASAAGLGQSKEG